MIGNEIKEPYVDNLKTNESDKFKEIKPVREESHQSIKDFWNNELHNTDIDWDEVDENPLFDEIYDCYENDINIGFEIDEGIRDLLSEFSSELWDEYSDVEKVGLLNRLADIVGARLGINELPAITIVDGDEEIVGTYFKETNTIELNGKYLGNAKETVNTLMHEMRHAYQEMRAKVGETHEDMLYRFNFANYISPQSDGYVWALFDDYYNQYVEVDARAFAGMFSEVMNENENRTVL